MKTILVSGGAGFIGTNFVHDCLNATKYRIINLDKLTYAGNPENLSMFKNESRHVFVQGDIGDRPLLGKLLTQYKPSAIVNFAAETHVDRSIHGPEEFIQTNIVGTFNLLESVQGYWSELENDVQDKFRFLHVSTDEVYGSLDEDAPAFSERHPYTPNSPYSASKASSDHLVRAYHHTYGLPTLTTNCSNNYGPYQFPEKLIPIIITNALKGEAIPIYGDGKNIRDWLYVEDHCKAIRAVLDGGEVGEVYNIGGNSEKSNLDIVYTVCAILDKLIPNSGYSPHKSLIHFVEDRPGHDRRYAINFSKIQAKTGWEPIETFDSGIYKTVKWYLENPEWVDHVTTGRDQSWIQENYGERSPC